MATESFDADNLLPPPTQQSASRAGLNPLVGAANHLLSLVSQLRATPKHSDPRALRDSLVRDIKEFEQRARAAHIPSEKIIAARYALCTLLDETVASTPWGGSGLWAANSLLITFHNEASGGEKFFQLLSKLAENPAANCDLLELMYICLALGLEGRYRLLDNGRAQLDAIRERLAQLIGKQHGDYERDLAPHWRGVPNRRYAALTVIPLWSVAAICGLLLLGVYVGFRFMLNADSDPVFAKIQAIRVGNPPPPPPPKPVVREAPPRLSKFLAREIADGLVAVRDEDGRSVVTILGDRLFAPGSATIASEYEPLITRIAEALNSVPGRVLVTGHTDNRPIRSVRFASNWDLSEERARSVAQLLAARVTPPGRLTSEGRGETEPIASNESAADRARNRRVEVILFVPRATT
jgi:type VI secretion system protein ImpK